MKEENIKELLNAKDISEFYDIYYKFISEGGIELKDIDNRLVEKEKELITKIPKEQTVENGIDVIKK